MNSLVVYKRAIDKYGSRFELQILSIYKNTMQKHKNTSIKQKNASVVGFRLVSLASTTLIGVTTDSIFEQIC